MNPLLVNIIMISLIVRANTSQGLSLRFDYHLACASLTIIHHMAMRVSVCMLLGLHTQLVAHVCGEIFRICLGPV